MTGGIGGSQQGWSKTTVIPIGAPAVACIMEDDALTDHSEELLLILLKIIFTPISDRMVDLHYKMDQVGYD
uniref:Uncharacterized protein n=1 Tax=Rhizophagus irregularis (strain DAOM 181602 / DAOM 197198 / MUCL 43194) TaxID=747089 RepID=U9UXB9_RHIID